MRAAAERNKRQLMAAEAGGLAAFLGVPDDTDGSSSSSGRAPGKQPDRCNPAPPKTGQQQQQQQQLDQPGRERVRSGSPVLDGQQQQPQQQVESYEDSSRHRDRPGLSRERPPASRDSDSYNCQADGKRHQQAGNDNTKISQKAANVRYTESDIDEIGLSPWELRQKRLEAEQAARDAQYKDFQRQHLLEVKVAAARNKQAVSVILTNVSE